MNEHLLAEKTEKCAELRWRREQLENERVRILNNLDNIRKGEVNPLKRGEGINFGLLSAKNIVGQGANSGAPVLSSLADDPEARDRYLSRIPGMRDKLKADEERLQQLKEQHLNLYKREAMPFDEDELKSTLGRRHKPTCLTGQASLSPSSKQFLRQNEGRMERRMLLLIVNSARSLGPNSSAYTILTRDLPAQTQRVPKSQR